METHLPAEKSAALTPASPNLRSKVFIWVILLSSLVSFSSHAQQWGGVSQAEYQALVNFYHATNGNHWNFATNWLSSEPISTWYGVTVESGKVTRLILNNNNLKNTGNADVSQLTYLSTFEFEENHLTSVPKLPAGLKFLRCSFNQLTTLPNLPQGLQLLYCYFNSLSSLPNLPATLTELVCYNNQLTSLPPLPAALNVLYCDNNQLTSLPALPASLAILYCAHNQLTSLPALPNGLTEFWCDNNKLTSLPAIPASLPELYCFNNQLTSLPALPEGLKVVVCENNLLTSLPDLPASLTELLCDSNRLTFEDLRPATQQLSPAIGFFSSVQGPFGPKETLSVNTGGSITLSADYADHSPLERYEWFKDGVPLVNEDCDMWTWPCNFISKPTYTITNATAADAGVYTCRITHLDFYGGRGSLSPYIKLFRNPITVTVEPGDLMLTASADTSLCAGTATVLTASALNTKSKAVKFDGINDYMATRKGINGVFPVSNTFTVEAWVKPDAKHEIDRQSTTGIAGRARQRYLMYPAHLAGQTKLAGMGISVGKNGVSVYEQADGYAPALLVWNGSITDWTHVAVVYTHKRPSLYINGKLVQTGFASTKTTISPSASFGGAHSSFYLGSMDEIRVWNKARTASEITAALYTAVADTTAGLVGYWRLNEGKGLSAVNAAVNADSLTLYNGAKWVNETTDVAYSWSPATGLHTTTGRTVLASPTQTTAYTVTATSSTGLTTSRTVNVEVTAPSLAVSVSPDTTICAGESVWLAVSSSGSCNQGLRFDGVNDYVATNQLFADVTNTFTVEAWVYPTATHQLDHQTNYGTLGYHNERYLVFPTHGDSLGKGHAGMGLSVGTNGVSVYEHAANYMPALLVWQGSLTDWTHVAVVYQDKTPSLYINGKLVKTGLTSPKTYVHPSATLGAQYYGRYKGSVDEFRVWNTARTADQIRSTLYTEPAPAAAGLAGYWNLNEGVGATTRDIANAFSTSTLNGPAWIASAAGTRFSWSPAAGLDTTAGHLVKASPVVTTTYTVKATDLSGLSHTNTVTVEIDSACEAAAGRQLAYEQSEQSRGGSQWATYPNPFTESTILQNTAVGPKLGPVQITVTDLRGKVLNRIKQETLSPVELGANLPGGIYLLQIRHKKTTQMLRVIKVN